MKRPRVLILIAGGTSLAPNEAAALRVRTARDVPAWMREIKELLIVADLEAHFISAGNGAHLEPQLWQDMAAVIQKAYKNYDGFVLTHDVETLHYTAPALACALEGIGKPVVMTASPYDLMRRGVPERLRTIFDEYRGFGNKDNLLNALHVSIADVSEICVVFGNLVHRAVEVTLSKEPTLNYFASLSGRPIGKIDFGVKFTPPVLRRHARPVAFRTSFNADIVTLDVHPGASIDQLNATLTGSPKAIFLKLEELTTTPAGLMERLTKLHRRNIPVFVYQEHGSGAGRSPFIRLTGLPYHSAFVFAVWALGQSNRPSDIQRLLRSKVDLLRGKGGRR